MYHLQRVRRGLEAAKLPNLRPEKFADLVPGFFGRAPSLHLAVSTRGCNELLRMELTLSFVA